MKALSKLQKLKNSAKTSFTIKHSIINDASVRKISMYEKEVNLIAVKHNQKKKIQFPDVGEVYRKFLETVPKGEKQLRIEFNTKRKIRKLANSLTYVENNQISILESNYIDLALMLISESFSGIIFNSLFITVLEKWEHPNTQKLVAVINAKRQHFKKKSQIIETLNEKSKYFFNNSAHNNLFNDITSNNIQLLEICNFLKIHDSCIRYQYFSVFIELFTSLKIKANQIADDMNNIFKFLIKHDNKESNKKCLTKIINYAEGNNFSKDKKMDIINFCYKYIGDPSIDTYWLPWSYSTPKDKAQIKQARELINQWLAHKFIYLFFEKIAMDNDRKDFWMQYLKFISNFKIYMEDYEREMFFDRNSNIESSLLHSKIGILKKSGNVSAFILQIKDYHIVEFSKTGGACYIYHNSTNYLPKLSKRSYLLSELKHKSNRKLAIKVDESSSWYYSSNFSTNLEGRVMHIGNWQSKFQYWIKNYLEIEV